MNYTLAKEQFLPKRNRYQPICLNQDFSEEEIQIASKFKYTQISLGDSRLRTETAAIAACHTVHVINQ